MVNVGQLLKERPCTDELFVAVDLDHIKKGSVIAGEWGDSMQKK
jgi:hypothetical protein